MGLSPTSSRSSSSGSSQFTSVIALADQSITASAVLTDDAELFFAAANGKSYLIELHLIFGSPAGGGTCDVKLAIGNGTSYGTFFYIGNNTADAGVNFAGQGVSLAAPITFGSSATDRMFPLWGSITGSGANFKLQWAQNTADVNPLIRRAGSELQYRLLN